MPKVLLERYTTFRDLRTGADFRPVLDRRRGIHVGVADVTERQAEDYADRPDFRVLSDAEFVALTEPAPQPEPEGPRTGDVLTDVQAALRGARAQEKAGAAAAAPNDPSGPPAPPASRK